MFGCDSEYSQFDSNLTFFI